MEKNHLIEWNALTWQNTLELGIKRNYFDIIKAISEKSTVNIIFSGERWKVFSLRSRIR